MTATGLTTATQSDGSTVYRGTLPAGQIARETGFKEGQAIRVLPFGYVAHDAAADPASLLDTAVTVGSDGVIREIEVTWGTWIYTVTYSDLGSTPPIPAPANAKTLRELRHLPPGERPLPAPPQPIASRDAPPGRGSRGPAGPPRTPHLTAPMCFPATR